MIPETTPDIEFHRIAELGNGVLGQINAMREAGPVIWSRNSNAWIVTRHQDLVDAYSGRLPLSNVRYQPAFAAVPEATANTRTSVPKNSPNTRSSESDQRSAP